MDKAKLKGEQELLARREKLMLELDKLGRRMEEFAECSELDMMQQVRFHCYASATHYHTVTKGSAG